MRFRKKLLAAIERGEWVRRRRWPKEHKIRESGGGGFVDETGRDVTLDAADVLADGWVIVRKKRKAPKTCVADDPRYEPVETMPVVGDKVAHPSDSGKCPPLTVEKILEAEATLRWRVEADSAACSLDKSGYGWRILKRRNVFTDPKLGDVIGRDHLTMEVKFVDAEAVMLRWNSGPPTATSRETWAAWADTGWTVRKLGA